MKQTVEAGVIANPPPQQRLMQISFFIWWAHADDPVKNGKGEGDVT